MLVERFRASVPKYRDDAALNEDAVCGQRYRGVYAVSDGASESHNSRLWARILTREFVARPKIDEAWVNRCVSLYNANFDREKLPWMQQGAFDRGSFATLLGVIVAPSGAVADVIGIGDSIAVLTDGTSILASFPYSSSNQFKANPLLLATIAERNTQVLSRMFARRWRIGRNGRRAILCMTDALGAWLLHAPKTRLRDLLALKSRTQFEALVDRERQAGRLKRDDTTLLILA